MNLELDILKKDIATLKQEINLLKEHLLYQDSRKYFKVQVLFEQPQHFDIDTWLNTFKLQLSCDYIGYIFDQREDSHFHSTLFPDLKNYKIQMCIYFSTISKHLPDQIENYFKSINGQLQIDSYIKQEEFDEICKRLSILKRF